MKTTLNRESPSRIRLTVEATADEVAPALERAVRALGSEVKIPGFRKGHVPRKVLESRIGGDAIREATLREAVPELLAKAITDETIAPIAAPSVQVQDYSLDADLTFDALMDVRPDVELPPLDDIAVTRPSTAPTDEEVEREMDRLRDRFATLETVARPARDADFVLIDVNISVHAERIDALSGTDQLYEVGSGVVVPELDRELQGKRTGDIVKFNAALPEHAGPEQAGREVTFQVLVKEVRERSMPALDDSFAKTASEFDTLDELRADLAERIRKAKGIQADMEVRQRILERVLEEIEVDPPESLVHEEMAYRLARFEDQLRAAGLTLERYLESSGATEEQIESDLRRQGERNVRAQLVLEEIGRREGFEVTQEDLEQEIRAHAEALREDPGDLRERLLARERLAALAGDIIRRKALNFLVEKADITEEDPEASPAEAER